MNALGAWTSYWTTAAGSRSSTASGLLAQMTPLAGEPAYMADLEDEILATEAAYVAGAVTEIASLRARLGGRQWG